MITFKFHCQLIGEHPEAFFVNVFAAVVSHSRRPFRGGSTSHFSCEEFPPVAHNDLSALRQRSTGSRTSLALSLINCNEASFPCRSKARTSKNHRSMIQNSPKQCCSRKSHQVHRVVFGASVCSPQATAKDQMASLTMQGSGVNLCRISLRRKNPLIFFSEI